MKILIISLITILSSQSFAELRCYEKAKSILLPVLSEAAKVRGDESLPVIQHASEVEIRGKKYNTFLGDRLFSFGIVAKDSEVLDLGSVVFRGNCDLSVIEINW